MTALQCTLFGHNWGEWWAIPNHLYPSHCDPDATQAKASKCTRCGETHVQVWNPPTPES